ncbi:DUF3027 domain-containing protein [Amycolatopsis sp. A133]|uniref:DUF3027 domain-containing protein n=1 Tax=Amycolatopsis sp. A133 TaxID=3064472 RepID=UPI0027E95F03|nr:DUF3027 domain-containing protein [Amycolatopsis sp. A133]MDQ7806039.1 DUF3027 domain-containing protein [Amycolatopsis sp. A133]
MTLLLTLDDGSVQRKLADAVEFARAAVLKDAPEEQLGAHVGVTREDAVTASHLFEAQVPGYGGWRWSVTVALAGDDEPVTVSEVVLVPGPDALVAPAWVPWERRVRAGDLGVGDIFPTDENDPRLAPAYLQSDDPAVEEVSREAGLGRVHVLSRFGRTEAASRWHAGEFGPRSDMARSAPDVCGTCGFFVPLAGSLRGVFGVCSNDIAPADGHVVDVEYGCGAHSEVEVEVTSSVPVAELVYDDSLLDYAPAPEVVETAAAEPETGIAESDLSPAEVEPEVATEPAADESAVTEAGAEPVEAAEVPEEVTSEVTEPVEVADGPVAEDASAEVGEVAEPGEVEASVVAEPVVAEVPEPAEAEPTQAEVTDAIALQASPEPLEATTESEAAEIPAAAESDAAEVDPLPAEVADLVAEPVPAEAVVPEPADAEPTQAEVTDAVATPEPAEAAPVQAEAPEAEAAAETPEAEVPEAVLTDNVVTAEPEPETPEADEAQAQVDNAPER